MIRWIYLIKYPEGIPVEEGEAWYLGVHTQEAKQMAETGMIRYRTWRAVKAPFGAGSRSREELNEWERLSELVFEDWDAFERSVVNSTISYTMPAYVPDRAERPFVYTTVFLGDDEPEYDLLAEMPEVE